ncbi:STM3941 family protein [Flavobacterium cyclinae]|uniref:STM3941 family protein n=1 Tax=Flavobacterium cyclinae TaxID=2895947 RepID=UPI001E56C617|nr:STM3941 family protein [Flavobacterium cyclinae]UGS21889.1 hypothetical protein LOS86_04480 [Flavobacterium cyclinae]
MFQKEIQYKFSPLAIIVSLIIFLFLFIILVIIIVALFSVKAYLAIIFLGFLLFIISNEAIPNLFRFSRHLIKGKPALILTEKELIDNVNNITYSWTEIKKIKYQFNYPANHISIEVKSPSFFLKKETNSYKRLIMKLNAKYFNGTFSLKPMLISCKKSELVKNLNIYLKKGNIENKYENKKII